MASIQTDDDYEVMLFKFRDWNDEPAGGAGTIVLPSGDLDWLEDEEIAITSLREWESPHTDGVYPLDWDIDIRNGSWQLHVRTVLDDQEMYNPAQNYWEGSVEVTGLRNGKGFTGIGYTELSGYASDPLDPKH